MTPADKPTNRGPLFIAHLGFVLTGMVTTVLGPLLPSLSARWSLSDSRAGYFFTAQFIGSLLAVTASGPLITRFGYLPVLAAGFTVMAAGIGGLAAGTWQMALVCAFGSGIGFGIAIPTTNLLVSKLEAGRQAAALNILNAAWCLGAVASPPAIALLLPHSTPTVLLSALSIALAAIALVVLTANRAAVIRQAAPGGHERAGVGGRTPEELRSRLAWLTGVLLFLYVGAETAIGGWIPSYIMRLPALPKLFWALSPSIFWIGILFGRVAAPAMLRRIPGRVLILLGLSINCAGVVLLLSGQQANALFAGVILAGVGFACIFPTAIAVFSEHYGDRAPRLAGFVFAGGGLGGAVIPALVGYFSTRFHGLRSGMIVPLLCTLAMIAIQLRIASLPIGRKPATERAKPAAERAK